ncbi:hypothetical protein GY45DRAFT_1374066 [Cubamyces sp. BRFM 1775]|nr:hypothetical protein GY45DRAFT_1374066 [Cubamyces sp. BRFM 1775]
MPPGQQEQALRLPVTAKLAAEKPDEKELPAAMVALVSTAVFAAIDHHRTSPCEISNFSTNSFGGAYKHNIAILSSLKEHSLEVYHDVMHELFKAVCGGIVHNV